MTCTTVSQCCSLTPNPTQKLHPVAMQPADREEKNNCKIVVADPRRTRTARNHSHCYRFSSSGFRCCLHFGASYGMYLETNGKTTKSSFMACIRHGRNPWRGGEMEQQKLSVWLNCKRRRRSPNCETLSENKSGLYCLVYGWYSTLLPVAAPFVPALYSS